MPPKRTVRARSAVRLLVVGVVAATHLGLLLLASAWQPPEPAPNPSRQTYSVVPIESAPFAVRLSRRRPAGRVGKKLRKPLRPDSAPTSRWTLGAPNGSAGGAAAAAGQFGRDAPDDFAVREALRASVGCDLEGLKLRPDEQDRCDERSGRWAKKGHRIGPAGDDPKRAAELAADENYARRLHAWKSWGGSPGPANSLQDYLGPMPPKKGP